MASPQSSVRRPPTPKEGQFISAPTNAPPPPPIPKGIVGRSSTTTTAPAPQKRGLGFLRRSKSGDPMKKQKPVVAPEPPELPSLFVSGQNATPSLSKELFGKDIRDSVEIISNKLNRHGAPQASQLPHGGYIPGRKSTDSVVANGQHYVTSSQAPLTEDPYAQVGSMANRGRFSVASSHMSTVNSPRRVRRRRDPTPFNILIIGARNSGKTSFLRFLRQSLAIKNKRGQTIKEAEVDGKQSVGATNGPFKPTYIETEVDGERMGLTLWDSEGLERNLIDLQIRETVAFIENKFEETFSEETKVVRAPGSRDTHIHVVFLLLDPARLTPDNHYPGKTAADKPAGGLDSDLDIQVFTALQGKTIVVPIISKADTCTSKHMDHLKQLVRTGLHKAGLDPLQALELEDEEYDDDTPNQTPRASAINIDARKKHSTDPYYDDEDDENSSGSEDSSQQSIHRSNRDRAASHASSEPRKTSAAGGPQMPPGLSFVPLSIISPDSYEPGERVGRSFPWGFADPYDEAHCDFVKLKESVFSEWRQELRDKSRIQWYEYWRSERLASVRGSRLY